MGLGNGVGSLGYGDRNRVGALTLPTFRPWASLSQSWERVVWLSCNGACPERSRGVVGLLDFQLCRDFAPRYILDHEN